MLFAIKNSEDIEKIEELALMKNKLEEFRLQDKIAKQNYNEDAKKIFELLTDTNKFTSESLTKTITETYINNNKAIANLNEIVLEFMKDKGILAPHLASSLLNLLKPENKSQFRLIKDLNSTKIKDFSINTSVPVTLYSKMLSF